MIKISAPEIKALHVLATNVLKYAQQQGATACEMSAGYARGFDVNIRGGHVDTLEYQNDNHVNLTVFLGNRSGSVSTSDISKETINQCVDKAIVIAKQTQEDPFSGLADKALLSDEAPDLDLHHPWALTPKQAIAKAIECESGALAFDSRITHADGVTVNTQCGYGLYANSLGFSGGYQRSSHSISCCLIASDGHAMQRDYDYSVACDPKNLNPIAKIAQQAAERTVKRLGAQRLSTQKSPVIFAPRVARSLLASFIAAIRGGNLYRQSSFLLDRLGKPVFTKGTLIQEHPHLPGALGSAPFDAEGVKLQTRDIVNNGILQGYVLNSYTARKLNMQTTGNAGGVRNLTITKGRALAVDDLIKKMNTGLLVTELMGQGVNIVTGDYSRGAFGFWVENGEIQYPVEEITIAGNLKELFSQLIAVGDDVDDCSNIRTGSLLFEQMTIAGA